MHFLALSSVPSIWFDYWGWALYVTLMCAAWVILTIIFHRLDQRAKKRLDDARDCLAKSRKLLDLCRSTRGEPIIPADDDDTYWQG